MECEGWAPGSTTNPTQENSDLSQPRFPYDEGLVATIRPLDDYSNTYIGLYVEDPSLGHENLMDMLKCTKYQWIRRYPTDLRSIQHVLT